MRTLRRHSCAVALALTLVGCGSDSGLDPADAVAPIAPTDEAVDAGAALRRPVVDEVALVPVSPRPGDRVRAEVRASHPDGRDPSLHYRWRINGVGVGDDAAHLTVPDVRKGSMLEVEVAASVDGMRSASVDAVARVANRPPSIRGVSFEPTGPLHAGREIVARAEAIDPDGDEIGFSYRWFIGDRQLTDRNARLEPDSFRRGDRIRVAVVASDGEAESPEYLSDIVQVENAPPRITSEPGPFDEDGRFRYHVDAVDPDGDRHLEYRLVRAPAGMSIDESSGALSWDPTEAQSGRHDVEVEVDDRFGGRDRQAFVLGLTFDRATAPAAPE